MATDPNTAPRGETHGLQSEPGGMLSLAIGLQRTGIAASLRRRHYSWQPLDLRRRTSVARMSGTLPPGLPFAMGLSSVLAAWMSLAPGEAMAKEAPSQHPGLLVRATERLRYEVLRWSTLPSGSVGASGAMLWTLGIGPTAHDAALPSAAENWRPLPAGPKFPEPVRPSTASASEFGAPASTPSGADIEHSPDVYRSKESDGTASPVAPISVAEVGGRRLAAIVLARSTLTSHDASAAHVTPGSRSPRNPEDLPIPAPTSAPKYSTIPMPPRIAPRATGIIEDNSSRGGRVSRARTMSHAELPWIRNFPVVASGGASPGGAHPDNSPAGTTSGQLGTPEFVMRKATAGDAQSVPVLSSLVDPLRQMVVREVGKQVAYVASRHPPPPLPAAPKAPAFGADGPSDDFVRRLLSRMRTIFHEERFRGGLLR